MLCNRSSTAPTALGVLDLGLFLNRLNCFYVTREEKKRAGRVKPAKPERKLGMWWGGQTAARGELSLCVAFFFNSFLPPQPHYSPHLSHWKS